ncbi:MAG: CDP-alcohol phosphatidyltransferase family protein [Anaerolineales bacterium]|nr:CDP-alcohol phosphatidyltransferase family protein [Anaerolineales bacterium]MDW8162004.1 CDP-alcohol phosphatidyltransferase family protein [Anaerolineales bacterium]
MNRKTDIVGVRIGALHKRWLLTLLAFGLFLWGMNFILAANWGASIRWLWTVAAGAFCAYVLAVLWKALPLNYRVEDRAFLPYFGAGNLVSLFRGWLLAALAGFLFTPLPVGWMAWLPGTLYILNGIADLFDGYLARRLRQVTVMGERLDMSLDGLGVLFASILLFRYGTLPFWVLFVGLARFLFLLVAKLREKLGKPVYDLPPSNLRRALAGAQMGFLGAVLLPVFTPPATVWAGAFFSLPFLLNFGRDLLWMCGVRLDFAVLRALRSSFGCLVAQPRGWILDWLLFGLRLGIGYGVGKQIWSWLSAPPQFLSAWTPLGSAQTQYHWMVAFYGIGVVSVVLGLVGRVGAALLLIGVGLQQGILPLGWLEAGILTSACLLFLLGSGEVSIWRPEERLIRQRWGER